MLLHLRLLFRLCASATSTGCVIPLTLYIRFLLSGRGVQTNSPCPTHVAAFLSGTDSYKMVSLMRRPDAEMAEGVGMWSTLMEAMGFLAVLTNTAIICFTGGALDSK